MKVIELINEITHIYDHGTASEASRLRWRHIYSKMKSIRSKLVYDKIEKKRKVDKRVYTFIPCMELELTPKNQCPCIPPKGCYILRTKCKLPKLFENDFVNPINFVMSTDGSIVFSEIDADVAMSSDLGSGSKYAGADDTYFILDGVLYLPTQKMIEYVSLSILQEDPLEVVCPCGGGTPGDEDCEAIYEREFNIDSDLVYPMMRAVADDIFNFFIKTLADDKNDHKDKGE